MVLVSLSTTKNKSAITINKRAKLIVSFLGLDKEKTKETKQAVMTEKKQNKLILLGRTKTINIQNTNSTNINKGIVIIFSFLLMTLLF